MMRKMMVNVFEVFWMEGGMVSINLSRMIEIVVDTVTDDAVVLVDAVVVVVVVVAVAME